MKKLSQIWFQVQHDLFPYLEEEFKEPLTLKLKQLVPTLEIVKIKSFISTPISAWPISKEQSTDCKTFIAISAYIMNTTRELVERLKLSSSLWLVCGWEKTLQIPHESSFSRTLSEFALTELSQIIHN